MKITRKQLRKLIREAIDDKSKQLIVKENLTDDDFHLERGGEANRDFIADFDKIDIEQFEADKFSSKEGKMVAELMQLICGYAMLAGFESPVVSYIENGIGSSIPAKDVMGTDISGQDMDKILNMRKGLRNHIEKHFKDTMDLLEDSPMMSGINFDIAPEAGD